MTDPKDAPRNQPQIVSTNNLFFLLQTLAQHSQARANEWKSCVESSIADEQVEEHVSQNGVM